MRKKRRKQRKQKTTPTSRGCKTSARQVQEEEDERGHGENQADQLRRFERKKQSATTAAETEVKAEVTVEVREEMDTAATGTNVAAVTEVASAERGAIIAEREETTAAGTQVLPEEGQRQ